MPGQPGRSVDCPGRPVRTVAGGGVGVLSASPELTSGLQDGCTQLLEAKLWALPARGAPWAGLHPLVALPDPASGGAEQMPVPLPSPSRPPHPATAQAPVRKTGHSLPPRHRWNLCAQQIPGPGAKLRGAGEEGAPRTPWRLRTRPSPPASARLRAHSFRLLPPTPRAGRGDAGEGTPDHSSSPLGPEPGLTCAGAGSSGPAPPPPPPPPRPRPPPLPLLMQLKGHCPAPLPLPPARLPPPCHRAPARAPGFQAREPPGRPLGATPGTKSVHPPTPRPACPPPSLPPALLTSKPQLSEAWGRPFPTHQSGGRPCISPSPAPKAPRKRSVTSPPATSLWHTGHLHPSRLAKLARPEWRLRDRPLCRPVPPAPPLPGPSGLQG